MMKTRTIISCAVVGAAFVSGWWNDTKRGQGVVGWWRVFLVFSSLLFGPISSAEVTRLDGRELATAEVDAQIVRLMQAAKVTGIGVAVFNEGKAVYLKAHGVKDRKSGEPLGERSVMYGASLAKAVFATVVMQLVTEGALDLDQPIEHYLTRPLSTFSGYGDLEGDARVSRFTLRMLLSHTSGLPNWRMFTPNKKLAVFFEPGSRYAYSGEGIAIAQLVVEKAAKRSLDDLIQERVFGPLAMDRTAMVWQPAFADDLALGHDEEEKVLGHRKRSKAQAAGSMDTCLADYAKFVGALLQGRLLSPAALEEMTRPQVTISSAAQFPTLATETTDENRVVGLSYGLGWGVLEKTPYGRAFFKEGHDDGWEHYSVAYAKSKTAVVLMTNSSNGESIFKELIEILTGDSSLPWKWEGYVPYNHVP
jgi:CubicO group peptidase (beta-lactamase class C family)